MAHPEYIWIKVKVGTSTNGCDVIDIEQRLQVIQGSNGWITLYDIDAPFPEASARGLAAAVTEYIRQKTVDIYAMRENLMGGTSKEQHRATYTIREEK